MSIVMAGGSPDSGRRRNRTFDARREDEDSNRMKAETDSDIKDYAETTMNELLGWYGLDKLDTRGLNLKNLNHHFPTSSSSSSPLRHDDEILSDEENGRRSGSPIIESESLLSNPSNETIICAWCLKTGLKLFTLKTSSGKTKVFCSEPCFNQCRRAAFKKNRVCNWCRHVRHTVNYVDFKDGDDQLQFCSDKCLNQYKMQIFCRETQAYLQMNPHLQEETNKNANTGNSKLITPDLWLRDCQEPANDGIAQNASQSDDDVPSPSTRAHSHSSIQESDLEDLTVKSKSDKFNSTSPLLRKHSQENAVVRKSFSFVPNSVEMANTLPASLSDDREKMNSDRRKRLLDNNREHFRKKQRMVSSRHRINHQEAPPAHLSSSTTNFPAQNRLFQPIPPYLPQSTPPSLNPPAAHSKAVPPHTVMPTSLIHPSLPPPPPLLNSDYLHSQFNPQLLQSPFSLSHQQQMEAMLRMHSNMNRRAETFPSHLLPESAALHSVRNSPPHFNPGTSLQPNTVMLPYPVFLPLPVPIPIPIPLSCFLKKNQKQSGAADVEDVTKDLSTNSEKDDKSHVDADDKLNSVLKKSKNSKLESTDSVTKEEKAASYAVTNNDSHTNRLIITRNKIR